MPTTAQLAEAQRVLDAYGQDTDALGTIRDSITERVYDNLRPEHERVAHYEQSQLPTFYDAFSGYGMGTGRGDLSPTAALAAATQDVARQSRAAQSARGILDTRRSRMEDLIGRTYDQWQHGYGAAQDAYNRAWQAHQAEEDRRRWEAEMALRRQQLAAQQTPAPVWPQEEVPDEIKQLAFNMWREDAPPGPYSPAYGGYKFPETTTGVTPARSTPSGYGIIDSAREGIRGTFLEDPARGLMSNVRMLGQLFR